MSKPHTLLVAEDDPATRRILQKIFAPPDYTVFSAADGDEALRLYLAHRPSLVISDWMMPKICGLDLCRAIRGASEEHYTYVVLLTTKSERSDVVSGLEAGADDYITKPFNCDELTARVQAGLRIVDLEQSMRKRQAELEAANRRLAELAETDTLTKLWNRSAIMDALSRELARAQRENNSIAVMMADIDHFKLINDSYGHFVGDAVLRETAQRMRRAIRQYDGIGRYGGEEFLIFMCGCDLLNGVNHAERLSGVINSEPIETEVGAIRVTISVGVALHHSGDEPNVDRLIRSADAALYRAKRSGRNRVEANDSKSTLQPCFTRVDSGIRKKTHGSWN